MKMINGLPAVAVGVDDDAVTVVGKPLRARDLGGLEHDVPDCLAMLRTGCVERIEMLARHDQNMRRRLRADVVESKTDIVLINLRRRDLAFHDPAKQTIIGHS